jgi:hypothetical protein
MFYYESIPNQNYEIKFVSIKSKKKIKEISFEKKSYNHVKRGRKKSSKKMK